MVKSKAKTRRRQSLRVSSQKVSKPKPSLRQNPKPRLVPSAESVGSEYEEGSVSISEAESAQAIQVETAQADSSEESDSSSSSNANSSLSKQVARPKNSGPQSSTTAPVVSSTLSSTITKWMSNKATSANDKDTRRLFGQLAAVMPLQGSSQLDNARSEAVRGLTSSSKITTAKTKGKARQASLVLSQLMTTVPLTWIITYLGPFIIVQSFVDHISSIWNIQSQCTTLSFYFSEIYDQFSGSFYTCWP